ncbi:MAG: translation initiation factor IF-2 [Proteobacteria bacterium]|nr:translation initiation factor IF-2 [Pseudomonadota bacterium]
MSEVTVKQFAETVGTPVERLLKQLQDAGLPHKKEDEAVSAEEKQALLAHLQQSHGSSDSGPKKVTLNRKKISTLKTGQRKAGRSVNVTVEVRRKKTYVRRGDILGGESQADTSTARAPSQSQLEAKRIREEELARKTAEEETQRKAAERKAKEEARLAAESGKLREEEALKAQGEAKAEEPAKREEVVADAGEAAAEAQAQQQATERGGKRAKGIAHDRKKISVDEFGDGKGRRRKLSMGGSGRPRRRKVAPMHVEQRGSEFSRPTDSIEREVEIPDLITVGDLAQRMTIKAGEVIKTLMGIGVMATINQVIDADTAELVVAEFGHTVKRVSEADVEVGLEGAPDTEESLKPRAPVVTIMGHVDHGKTSLLDALRQTDVASHEAGGITQHIGAYRVELKSGNHITFLDTPGHEAFTAMRARGAKVTDIVVLVVAADDGVKPQTVEAIHHAKAAEVPIIVAINKIDRPDADPDKVGHELLQHDIVLESMGGEVLAVEVSAKEGTNLDKLEETILLQSEILEFKANPDRPADGVVVEAKIERGRGNVATVLVQRGTLRVGDVFVAGGEWGHVRALIDDRGRKVEEANPSMPVEVLGLNGTPMAGDEFTVVENEARARQVTEFRQRSRRDARAAIGARGTVEQLLSKIADGGLSELSVIVKADVHGTMEAIIGAFEKFATDEVAVRVLHAAVGGINESDVTLANTTNALIVGFNVRANPQARNLARRDNVEIRYYSVIYDLTDDIKAALSGMLPPTIKEILLGNAEIREVFSVTKVGKVAGCMVTEGLVKRGAKVRLLRDNIVIHQGSLKSLKRFKDEVREVKEGYECGMSFENYQDIRAADVIECFEIEEIARTL